jgi:hypothetical protein
MAVRPTATRARTRLAATATRTPGTGAAATRTPGTTTAATRTAGTTGAASRTTAAAARGTLGGAATATAFSACEWCFASGRHGFNIQSYIFISARRWWFDNLRTRAVPAKSQKAECRRYNIARADSSLEFPNLGAVYALQSSARHCTFSLSNFTTK